ncbi:MAG: arginine--tRNA ligase [Clostridia bacterium]|nr:arginine--tRNA ligase [Clostridia bacterium]
MDFKQEITALIEKKLDEKYGKKIEGIYSFIEQPPNPEMGDYAFPCFRLAKELRMGPPMIAKALSEGMEAGFLDRAEQNGGYLNFFIKKEYYAKTVIESALDAGMKYGSSVEGEGKTICLDYSSVNIAKPFHLGHLYTTVIGNSLKRIFDFLGYKTVSINHLGDWGTQFGKLICAFKKWSSEEKLSENPMQELVAIYVRFHDEAEKDPALEDEARVWNKRIEDGDEEAMSIYNMFKEITLKEVKCIYDMLGITFDSYLGEAFFFKQTGRVVEELKEKGIMKVDDGASIVDLEEYGMPPCLILRSDGATLYATRDLAAALYRKDTYDFYKCIYVTAYQQNLHFKQWFKVIELMGYEWAEGLVHTPYGMVSMEDGAMSTRKGHVIYLEDVFKASVAKAKQIMEEKSPDLADMDKIAQDVGLGAVVFSALSNNRIKDMVFSWDRALNFDGETGPYVQYTHARCCSAISKADGDLPQPDYAVLSDPASQALISLLEKLPAVIAEAANKYEPSMITRHTVDIAKAFNKFYFDNRIMDDDLSVRAARVALTKCARNAIAIGLDLIGVKAPEKM